MKMQLRLEAADEHYQVELLTREAFWGFMRPTCDEHYLAHVLRQSDAFIPELDYVCEIDGKLVGNVMYSKAKVITDDGVCHEVITFGPLSVLPTYWSCGVGSALMKRSILRAKELGYRGIVFFGHPDYYPRFGFQNSKVFGITTPSGKNYDSLMAMELYDGALDGIRGKFVENEVFKCDNLAEIEKFNARFPAKEPAQMVPIDVLLARLPDAVGNEFRKRKIIQLSILTTLSGRELMTWEGVDADIINIINNVLVEYNYSPKLTPDSAILENARNGIRVLDQHPVT